MLCVAWLPKPETRLVLRQSFVFGFSEIQSIGTFMFQNMFYAPCSPIPEVRSILCNRIFGSSTHRNIHDSKHVLCSMFSEARNPKCTKSPRVGFSESSNMLTWHSCQVVGELARAELKCIYYWFSYKYADFHVILTIHIFNPWIFRMLFRSQNPKIRVTRLDRLFSILPISNWRYFSFLLYSWFFWIDCVYFLSNFLPVVEGFLSFLVLCRFGKDFGFLGFISFLGLSIGAVPKS